MSTRHLPTGRRLARPQGVCRHVAKRTFALASLIAMGAAATALTSPSTSAASPSPSATFAVSGSVHLKVTSTICSVINRGGVRSVTISDRADPQIAVVVRAYQTGTVNLATTRKDLVSFGDSAGPTKIRIWLAGWSGALDPAEPSTGGSTVGSGTLVVQSKQVGARGHLTVRMKAASSKIEPGNKVTSTVSVSASWNCG